MREGVAKGWQPRRNHGHGRSKPISPHFQKIYRARAMLVLGPDWNASALLRIMEAG